MITMSKQTPRRRVRTPRSQLYSTSRTIQIHQDHFFMSGGIRKRKIFYNVRYTEEEDKWIQQVKDALKQSTNIQINQKETILRYYYSSNLQMDNCLSRLQRYHEWFNDPKIQKLTKESRGLLKKGFVYSYGVTKDNYPFSIMNLGDTDFDKYPLHIYYQALNHVNNRVINEKFVPGYIETYDYILDLNQKFLSLPISSLKQYIQTIADVYSMRMHRMFIINCTTLAKFIYSGVAKVLSEQTTRKIKIFTKQDIDSGMLLQFFDQQVLEVKYGGKKPNIDHELEFLEEEQQSALHRELSDTEYFSVEENNSMFQKEERQICCSTNECTIY